MDALLGWFPLLLATAGDVSSSDALAARQIQALSLAVHIPLVCFGIAFPAMVMFVHALWLKTGNPVYKSLAKRWSKVMLILFAVGVVTGTILSFEFGILWPEFMARYAEVFGLGFALEGFSFFLEAIFIALYVYGWDRFPRKQHFLLGIPVVIAGITGSTMVIAVNGWMNNPIGFDLAANGEVINPRPFEALFANGFLWHELVHMYLAGFVVVGFIVGGTYALAWLRGHRNAYNRAALIVALTVAALVTPVQLMVGDWAGREVAKHQPVKLAAMEGLYKTEEGAPLHLGGVYVDDEVKGGIKIPKGLSLVAYHDPNATVMGLEEVAPDDRPPVNVVRASFQIMVIAGSILMLIGLVYLWIWARKGRLPRSKWFYRAVIAGGPLAVVALITGWITTEVGRQPWIVYEVMRVSEATTKASGLWFALAGLIVVYILLGCAIVWLLRRLARGGGESGETDQGGGY